MVVVVPAHLGSPGKRAVKRVCVCVCVTVFKSGKYCGLSNSTGDHNRIPES